MTDLLRIGWPAFGMLLLVFGFAPGAVLRLIVLAYRRDDPRRRELVGELYAYPRIERPFWVIEQLELALFEGLRSRFARRTAHDVGAIYETLVYNEPTACVASGITYWQLQYWARTGLVEPSAGSPGGPRFYSFYDILMLKTTRRLLDSGISLGQIRPVIAYMRDCSPELPPTVLSDGENVYGCSKEREIVELLADGEGFFGIDLRRLFREVDSILLELPSHLYPGPSR